MAENEIGTVVVEGATGRRWPRGIGFEVDAGLSQRYTIGGRVFVWKGCGDDRRRKGICGGRIMISRESWQAPAADADLLGRCKQGIRGVVPDADVILYGSRARGDAASDSDYDLLVLVDQPVDGELRERLISGIYPVELETGAVLTLIAYSRGQWNSALYKAMPFRQNVEREGVLL